MQMNIIYTKCHKTKKTNYVKLTPNTKLKARTNGRTNIQILVPTMMGGGEKF